MLSIKNDRENRDVMTSFFGKIQALWGDNDILADDSKKKNNLNMQSFTSALTYDDDMLILCDDEGIILFFNDIVKKYFPIASLDASIFTILRSPILREIFEEILETDKNKLSAEIKLRIPNEKFIKIHAMRSDNGILLRLQDITEQKNALKMHGDFVANVSHELRTPLASICGFIETLQGPAKGDADATEQFLGIMSAQAGRMNHLIQGLLSLSRIEMDQHILPTTECDLTKVLQDVAKAMEPLLSARNMVIETEFNLDQPRIITAVPEQIFQVFQNLVENGMKYSPDNTKITLSVEEKDETYRVHVQDEGHGIEPEHLPRLTERFYRVDDARHRSEGGAGLGLSIVGKIIKRHQGTMEITSELSKGSDFIVVLPTVNSK